MLVELPRGPLVAPSRFRIWAAGNNPGDYGDNLFNDAAAARVMAEFERRGVAGAIDIEHATNPKAQTYSPAKAPIPVPATPIRCTCMRASLARSPRVVERSEPPRAIVLASAPSS